MSLGERRVGWGGGGVLKNITPWFSLFMSNSCVWAFFCLWCYSAGSTSSPKTRVAPVRGICCTRSGLIPKAFTSYNHLTWSGEEQFQRVSSWTWFKSDWHQDTEDIQYLSLPLLQKVLRREDRHLLRLVGFLHCDAGCGCCRGTGLLHLRI